MQTAQQRYGSQFDPQSRLVLSGTTVVAELQTPAQQLTPAVPFQPAVLSMRLSAQSEPFQPAQSETAVAAINARALQAPPFALHPYARQVRMSDFADSRNLSCAKATQETRNVHFSTRPMPPPVQDDQEIYN